MRRASVWPFVLLLVLTAACGSKKEAPAADTATAMAPPPAPRAVVTVIYNWPKDTVAFEKYYREVHVPLVRQAQGEIGYIHAELTRFTAGLDGKKPAFYRQAELYFPSMDAARTGVASPAFKRVADDLSNFATGGLTALIASETSDPSATACPAFVTVIYNPPTDTTAFEAYYPTHVGIVVANITELGVVRADLTRFVSNVDGTAPAKYRQAELCWSSTEARDAGMATSAFKKVGDDFPNFVTGGLTGMVGVTTN